MFISNLVRAIGVFAIAWFVLALGAGALGVGTLEPDATHFFVPEPALKDVVEVGIVGNPRTYQHRIVDRVSGSDLPIQLPDGEHWGLLSVSPWRDEEGKLEVVGRWTNYHADAGDQAFCGLAIMKLPDGTVTRRIALDVLPTGRPCLLPGRRGEVLFPTGDGQLYRCSLTAKSEAFDTTPGDSTDRSSHVHGAVRPVEWACDRPGARAVFLNDPFWSADARVANLVLVSLNAQEVRDGHAVFLPPRLWWLRMNDAGDQILSAGPLTKARGSDPTQRGRHERFPTLIASADGGLRVAYLGRGQSERSWRLHSADLVLDGSTGEPVPFPTENSPGNEGAALAGAPLLASADGRRVFALNSTGQIATLVADNQSARLGRPGR